MFSSYRRWVTISESKMNNINRYTPLPSIHGSARSRKSPVDSLGDGDERASSDEEINVNNDVDEDEDNADLSMDISDSSDEEIYAELTRRINALLKYDTYTSRKSLEHVYYISLVGDKGGNDRVLGLQYGDKLTSVNFVELFQKMWSRHMCDELFDLGQQDVLWLNMYLIRGVMWNMSDKSNAICERIIKTNLHSQLIGYLKSEHLAPTKLHQESRCDIVQGFIGTLHNVVQRASGAREALRECQSVDVLQLFRNCDHQMVSCVALMIQSYLVSEEENEKINSGIEIFQLLIQLLEGSINGISRFNVRFAVLEVLEAINKLAANDSNKERIVEVGALPYYVKLLEADRPEEEQKEAAHGLWILAFRCKKDIQKEPGCIEALKALYERTTRDDIKKKAEGALWILQDTVTETAPARAKSAAQGRQAGDDDGGHVFISYQWDAKPTVLKVRDRLRDAGFRVWIDEDDMSGSVLEAMAMAVEKAVVVVICLSQKYKDSPSCRTEAEYTFRLRKKIIPLRLQTKYYPDGWLGILVGSQLVFDCSQPNKVEESTRNLIKELGNMGRAGGHDDVDSPVKAQVASLSHAAYPSHEKTSPTNNWKQEDIDAWLTKHNLEHLNDWFAMFSGPLLLEYNSMRQDAPEAFFAHLMKRDLPLTDTLRLSRALKELI